MKEKYKICFSVFFAIFFLISSKTMAVSVLPSHLDLNIFDVSAGEKGGGGSGDSRPYSGIIPKSDLLEVSYDYNGDSKIDLFSSASYSIDHNSIGLEWNGWGHKDIDEPWSDLGAFSQGRISLMLYSDFFTGYSHFEISYDLDLGASSETYFAHLDWLALLDSTAGNQEVLIGPGTVDLDPTHSYYYWFYIESYSGRTNLGSFSGNTHLKIDNLTAVASKQAPEPATLLLLGVGFVGIIGYKKKFRKK